MHGSAQLWEYTVLVSNAGYDIAAIGQLYRDRCDCENGFDELKMHAEVDLIKLMIANVHMAIG